MSQDRVNDITAALTEALGTEPTTIPPTLNVNEDDAPVTAPEDGPTLTADEEATAQQVIRDAEAALQADLLDPTSASDKIAEHFNNVLLYGGAAVYGVDLGVDLGEDDDDANILDDDDEDEGDDVASSAGSRSDAGGEPEPDDDDILDWDKISENESRGSDDEDDDGMGGAHGAAEPVDKDFLNWLNLQDEDAIAAQRRHQRAIADDEDDNAAAFEKTQTQLTTGQQQPTALEADLQRLHVSEVDEYIANGPMPERFMAEAVANNRPQLKNIPLQREGAYYELNDEALWILLQLRKPGYMLSRSTIAAGESRKPIDQLRESPLVVAIRAALDLMIVRHLEPAHIAIYHLQETQALLDAYYDNRQHTMEDGTVRLEAAYSALTGQRQLPYAEGDYSVFATRPAVSDDVDPLWRNERRRDYQQRAIRKPASILLGRLLWQIFDLDMLCHKLERGRLSLVLDMQYNNYFLGPTMSILQDTTFQDPVEMLFWAQYTKYCARRLAELPINRGTKEERMIRAHRNWNTRPTLAVEDLNLEVTMMDLFLPAETYLQNLSDPTKATATYSRSGATRTQGEELFSWLTRIGGPIGKDAVKVLKLFVGAFIEQYSKLPLLRKIVFDTFLELGEVTVVPVGPVLLDGFTGPQSYRIAQLLGQNPLHYLRLQQYATVPAGQTAPIQMEFSVNSDYLIESLRMKGLFMEEGEINMTDSFAVQRSESFREMAQYVAEQTIPHVRAALLRAANLMAAALSATELGKLCAEGPYQPTRLAISAFSATHSSWDSSWNVAEALPETGRCVAPGAARVCGVYLADRTSTATFVFCDAFGGVVGSLRWLSCNPSTPDGLQTHRRQCVLLLSAIRKHAPNVIAVAMCNDRASALFRVLEDFVRDYVWPDMSVNLPVVWTSGASGTVYRFSETADREMTNIEHPIRYAASTARYARDPLMELCRFFDPATKDILKFPLYIAHGADEQMVYTHLEREMSLWVTAVGYDLNAVLAQTRPELVLQFCAGMGRRKAAKVISFVTLCSGIASRQPLVQYFDMIGSPTVAENFIPTIRIEDNGEKAGEAEVHPCDATLLPREWYCVADLLVQTAIAVAGRVNLADPKALEDACPVPLAWARILELDETARWRLLAAIRSQEPILMQLKQMIHRLSTTNAAVRSMNERHLDLILDEVTAMGKSYQRRPYRHVTSRVLMKQMTNVTFFTRADILAGASKACDLDLDPRELIVKEGDLLECSVMGVMGGAQPAIKVSTSRGLSATIPVTEADFENAYMRQQFYNYVNEREEARQKKSSFNNIISPEWLRKDSPIFGIVTSCNFARCELRLRWSPAPIITEDDERRIRQEDEEERLQLEEGEDDLAGLAGIRMGGNNNDGTASSAASSVKALALNDHAMVFRTKASRHALFRNVISNNTIERLLLAPDVDIGELLLRPVAGHSSWISLCIKVGTDRVINWPIRECRGRSGNLFYEVPDRRLDKTQTFDSVDHCIYTFVEKMAVKINQLRQHRRFYPSVESANGGIAQAIQEQREQLVDEARQFAYAFAETASPTGLSRLGANAGATNNTNNSAANNTVGGVNSASAAASATASHVPYCVVYMLNGRSRQSPVHVDNEGFYVKLKTVRSATSQNGVEWFRASDPETLSFVIKNYASQLHKLQAKASKTTNQNASISGRGGSSLQGRGASGGVAVAPYAQGGVNAPVVLA